MSNFYIDSYALGQLTGTFAITILKDGSAKLEPIFFRPNGLMLYIKQTSANSIRLIEVSDNGLEITSDNTLPKIVDAVYNKYCVPVKPSRKAAATKSVARPGA